MISRTCDEPIDRTRIMNWRSRSDRTCERTIRATVGHAGQPDHQDR